MATPHQPKWAQHTLRLAHATDAAVRNLADQEHERLVVVLRRLIRKGLELETRRPRPVSHNAA